MTFDIDFEFSLAAQPLQDKLYRYIFKGYLKNITRFSKEDRNILDIKYHIDIELEFINGIKILGQEKTLRYEFINYNTLTIEFYQNRVTKEKGEFFNLGAQFFLHGYVDGNIPEEITRFLKCYFIKIFDFLEWLKRKSIEELEKNTRPTKGSRASFYWIRYNDIPKEFIYWHFEHGKELIKKEYFDFNISNNPKQLGLFKKDS